MKFTLSLYLLTCLGLASLVNVCCRASADEPPVKYIFELSDEPVKVHPGKIDTKSVFFPKYARGTSPEALKQQAAVFHLSAGREEPQSIDIHMHNDREEAEEHNLTGYEFHHPDARDGLVITTEAPDKETWLNDGDPDSPFFHTPRSATSTKVREITPPSDLWPVWEGQEINLSMTLPEAEPCPFMIQPTPSTPIRTVTKSSPGGSLKTESSLLHPAWNQLPPGYVPIPALPAYQPTMLRKLK